MTFSLFSYRIYHAKQFDSKMNKIGQLLKKLCSKRTLMKQKKFLVLINNFLIRRGFMIVFGIYA